MVLFSPFEVFTVYTEVDIVADRIQFTVNRIDLTPDRDETVHLHRDKGADHFGDFTHTLDVRGTYPSVNGIVFVWGLANDVADDLYRQGFVHSETIIVVELQKMHASGTRSIYIRECVGNDGTNLDGKTGLSMGTWYYLKVVKSGTSFVCGIYSTAGLRDAGDGTDGDIGNLAITLVADHKFRYIYACSSWNSGTGTYNSNAEIKNLSLNE